MGVFLLIFYYVVFISIIIWILYDIINLFIKKKNYIAVDAEVCKREHIYEPNSPGTYGIVLKYFYDDKECYYSTKWSANFFIPKVGAKRKIYINKNDSSKVYYVENKLFVAFILLRMCFLIPLYQQL